MYLCGDIIYIMCMKKLSVLFVLLAFMTACINESGVVETKRFAVGDFDKVSVTTDAFDIEVCDTVDAVTVIADGGVMRGVKVEVKNGELSLGLSQKVTKLTGKIKVLLPKEQMISKLTMYGGSEFRTGFVLSGDNVELSLLGSAHFYGDVNADRLTMEMFLSSCFEGNIVCADLGMKMHGSAVMKASGHCDDFDCEIYDFANFAPEKSGENYAFECGNGDFRMSGNCKAAVHCNGLIAGSLHGFCELRYTGDADVSGCQKDDLSKIIKD